MKWLIILFICFFYVSADIVKLKNGGEIEGKIIKNTDKIVIIEQGKIQIELEKDEIETIIKKKYKAADVKLKSAKKEMKVYLKGENVLIGKHNFNICKDTATLDNQLFKLSKNNITLTAVAYPTMSVLQLQVLMALAGKYSYGDFLVIYNKKQYKFIKHQTSGSSGERLLHTLVIEGNKIIEGKKNGYGATVELNNKDKNKIKSFFNSVAKTKSEFRQCIDSYYTLIAMNKNAKVKILFNVIDELTKINLTKNQLAFLRDKNKNDSGSDCWNNIINSPFLESGNKNAKKSFLTGGRNRENISTTVKNNLKYLKDLYNDWRKKRSDFKGQVMVKFAINERGEVIYATPISSTINEPKFSEEVAEIVKKWKFDKIDVPGDITEIVYPFNFSP